MRDWIHRPHRSLYLALLVSVLCLATGALAVTTITHVLADTERLGSLSGVVRNQSGVPVDQIRVTLTGDSVAGFVDQTTVTDSAGRYSFGALAAGLYYIRLEDTTDRYPSPQYYDDAIGEDGATPIAVNGEDISAFDLTLYAGGELRGRVTNQAGEALANVEVTAYRRYSSSSSMGQSVTDSEGRYVITALGAGVYILEFVDHNHRHFSKFYGGASSTYSAELIGISANGRLNNLDTRLEQGSTISGQVVGSDGVPLAGIFVRAAKGYYADSLTRTDENGTYTLGVLTSGRYQVSFTDLTDRYDSEIYITNFFDDRITVGEKENITDIDITLTKRGAIEGTVTDEAGTPLVAARVRAIPRFGYGPTRTAMTDARGRYLLEGLSLVEYGIEFSKPESIYLREYYSNATTLEATVPITVFAGNTLTNINASLASGGAISGVVSHTNQTVLGQVVVTAFPQSSPLTPTIAFVTNTVPFTYVLGGLPPEPHFISVRTSGITEYYENTSTRERAMPVAVTAGEITPNINFVLGDYADAATISGTVRATSGEPLGGVNVWVYCLSPCGSEITEIIEVEAPDPILPTPTPAATALPILAADTEPTWNLIRSILTDRNGNYQIPGLQPQPYRLQFVPSGITPGNHAFEYYNDALDLVSATEIDLQPFTVRTSLDATLEPGGTITGTVTIGDGYPVRDTQLWLYFWDGTRWDRLAMRSADFLTGNYKQTHLQSGRYRIAAAGTIGRESYLYFYGNTTVFTDAAEINVTAGLTVPNINISLDAAAFLNAAITGTVTAEGQPLSGIHVDLYNPRGSRVYRTTTDNAGHYVANNLANSSYYLTFIDPTATYAIGYTGLITTFSNLVTNHIYVRANEVISNVNVALVPGGTIEGRVTDIAGNGLKDIEVQVDLFHDGFWRSAIPPIHTDSDGVYRTPALHPGRYRIYFKDPFGRYPSRYYGNSATSERSPKIEARVGEAVTGINVMMSKDTYRSFVYLPIVAR